MSDELPCIRTQTVHFRCPFWCIRTGLVPLQMPCYSLRLDRGAADFLQANTTMLETLS
ncbi:MAG: hypothetical protein RL572_1614 [Pseudomonadota bacterium]|jgi:hypothetical protein